MYSKHKVLYTRGASHVPGGHGISIADAQGIITYVNDKFCDISGYSREELLGENHRILKSDEHSHDFYRVRKNDLGNTQ